MENTIEERYLYTISPKRPIRYLNPNTPLINSTKSLLLTKEEVIKCFGYATIYRRFSNNNIAEKITKFDIDRVHRTKYNSKEEWDKMQKIEEATTSITVNGVKEVEEKNDPIFIVEEPVIEEVKEPEVVEEVIDETATAEEALEVAVEDTVEAIEEEKEASEVVEEAIEDNITDEEEIDDSEEEAVVEEVKVEATDSTSELVHHNITNNNRSTIDYNKKKKHH